MSSDVAYSTLTEADAQTLDQSLARLEAHVTEVTPKEKLAWDDTSLKPLEQFLSTEPSDEDIRAAELGLGEVLKREFDLDWVSVEATDEKPARIGLNIPCTHNILYPDEFFFDTIKSGKPVNVRIVHIKWCEWIEEHAFD